MPLFLLLLTPFTSFAQLNDSYNEIYDNQGNVRSHYQDIWAIASNFSEQRKNEIQNQTLTAFEGDNPLFHVPRIITEADYLLISNGVTQRAKAIQAFLMDHYSGKKRYLKKHLIPEALVTRIIDRNYESLAGLTHDGTPLEFWYGPDIIRDQNGDFRVIEDNTGFIGGMGDLIASKEALLKSVPEYKDVLSPGHDPSEFYDEIADDYKAKAVDFGGIPLVIRYTPEIAPDNEDKRIEKIFKKRGIEVVAYDPSEPNKVKKLFRVTPDGLFWGNEKVGYLILDIEASDLDPKHPASTERFNQVGGWTIPDPLKNNFGIEGLWELVNHKKIGVTNPIGLEFINDKEFYIYIEKFIQFYLKEKPILKNINTRSFAIYPDGATHGILNEKLLNETMKNPSPNVFKGVNGRGGDQVSLGKKITPPALKELRTEIIADPEHFIVQDFTALSTVDNFIVDIRPLAVVLAKKIRVAPVCWGRGTFFDGNGKVNVAEGGKVTTMFVVDTELNCETSMAGIVGPKN